MRVSKAMSGWARKSLHAGTPALTVDLGNVVAIEGRLLRSKKESAAVVRREIAQRLQSLRIIAPMGTDLRPLSGLGSSTATLTSLDVSRVEQLDQLPVFWPLDKLHTLLLIPIQPADDKAKPPLPAIWAAALTTATQLTTLVCPTLNVTGKEGLVSLLWAIMADQQRRLRRLVLVGVDNPITLVHDGRPHPPHILLPPNVRIWTIWWLDALAKFTSLQSLQLTGLSFERWEDGRGKLLRGGFVPEVFERLLVHPRLNVLIVADIHGGRLEAKKSTRTCELKTWGVTDHSTLQLCIALARESTWSIDTLRVLSTTKPSTREASDLPSSTEIAADLEDVWTHGLSSPSIRHLVLDYACLRACVTARESPAPSILSIDLDMRAMPGRTWTVRDPPFWTTFPSLTRLVLRGYTGCNSPAPTLRKEHPNVNIIEAPK
jgi:hypothetical protein